MSILENQVQNRLKGQTAWITGGKRIGRIIARALAELGVNIVTSYRKSEKEARETIEAVKPLGVKALAVQADTSKQDSVATAVAAIKKTFPKINILVNMASVFEKTGILDVTEADWSKNHAAHVLGTFWPSQLALDLMPGGSHIINIADRTTIGKVYPGYVPYVVTKAAVASLTRALAVEYGRKGIFVNAIAPGPILRPDDIPEKEWQAIRNSSELKVAVNDEEAVEQFALLVIYLSTTTLTSGHLYPLDLGKNL